MDIKSARQAAGLTQQQLADQTGLNRSQVQKLERGEIKPGNITAKNLLAIADVLGIDPHELMNTSSDE